MRYTAKAKVDIINQYHNKIMTKDEICKQHIMSSEEFDDMIANFRDKGKNGLMITRR
jgi:hypothetical protein